MQIGGKRGISLGSDKIRDKWNRLGKIMMKKNIKRSSKPRANDLMTVQLMRISCLKLNFFELVVKLGSYPFLIHQGVGMVESNYSYFKPHLIKKRLVYQSCMELGIKTVRHAFKWCLSVLIRRKQVIFILVQKFIQYLS